MRRFVAWTLALAIAVFPFAPARGAPTDCAVAAQQATERLAGGEAKVAAGTALPKGVVEVAPPAGKTFKTEKLGELYVPGGPKDDVAKGVKYLDATEREAYRLRFGSDGKIYDASGKLFDTQGAKMKFANGKESGNNQRCIFVMDQNGNFYANNFPEQYKFHHSSFFSGGEVAGAGELQIVDGELRQMTDRSGHYQPAMDVSQQVVDRLRQLLGDAKIDALEKTQSIRLNLD